MRKLFTVLTGLLLLSVLTQFYLAAVGAFSQPQTESSYNLHGMNAMIIVAVSLLATIVGAVARVPRDLLIHTAVPVGGVLVQMLIVMIGKGDDTGTRGPLAVAFLGLHALLGIAILANCVGVFWQARSLWHTK